MAFDPEVPATEGARTEPEDPFVGDKRHAVVGKVRAAGEERFPVRRPERAERGDEVKPDVEDPIEPNVPRASDVKAVGGDGGGFAEGVALKAQPSLDPVNPDGRLSAEVAVLPADNDVAVVGDGIGAGATARDGGPEVGDNAARLGPLDAVDRASVDPAETDDVLAVAAHPPIGAGLDPRGAADVTHRSPHDGFHVVDREFREVGGGVGEVSADARTVEGDVGLASAAQACRRAIATDKVEQIGIAGFPEEVAAGVFANDGAVVGDGVTLRAYPQGAVESGR